jgi:hypothetical protein
LGDDAAAYLLMAVNAALERKEKDRAELPLHLEEVLVSICLISKTQLGLPAIMGRVGR